MSAALKQKPGDSVKKVEAEKMMSKYLKAGTPRHLAGDLPASSCSHVSLACPISTQGCVFIIIMKVRSQSGHSSLTAHALGLRKSLCQVK